LWIQFGAVASVCAFVRRRDFMAGSFVDIHCHMLPGIDDGAADWGESLAMAQMAADDGIATVIATPHQLGICRGNRGEEIRRRTTELQARLQAAGVPLTVLPGADVRVDADIVEQIAAGEVLTLGDHGRHVLVELPHDLYLPLEPLVARLARLGTDCILSHPERNEGILRKPEVVGPLVDAGCLLQITAGSVCGLFGPRCQQLAEWLLADGLCHFVATDAHGARSRRPLVRRAFERVAELTDVETATGLCSTNPGLVATGQPVLPGRQVVSRRRTSWWQRNPAA
jgi:protein-tyrosine phosphatase